MTIPTISASPWAEAADLLDPGRWLRDPVGWVKRQGQEPWSLQRQILESIRDNRRTSVPSCHESGKSWTAGQAATWWIDAHPPGSAFVVTTAPTHPQVRAILWKEINRAHARGHLRGECNQTDWWIDGEMVAMGRKPADYDAEAFQGIHARYVLVVIDEAGGVAKNLWDAAETLIANESGRILAIGNPDDPSSHFASTCKPGSGTNVIEIDAFATPNFTGEPVSPEVSESLISRLWAEERLKAWGADSPLYISKVRGKFPEYASDTVVPYQWAQACRKVDPVPEVDPEPPEAAQTDSEGEAEEERVPESVLGLDVGAGGDETVLRHRTDMLADGVWKDHTADPERVVNLAVHVIRETKATRIKIDVIGIGWGVAGWLETVLRDEGIECEVLRVNVGEMPSDRERFVNLRDEIWWEVGREFSRERRWDLSLVEDDVIAQLIAPKYSLQRGGRIKIEPKDDVRTRIGRSPDDADALLLCYFEPGREVFGAV